MMSQVWSWLRKELSEILPVWAFFFFSFSLIALTFSAVLKEYHVDRQQPAEYLVGSLVMAKVVVLIDAFVKKEWLRNRPLIYMTLWNTGLYVIAALIVHYLERFLALTRRQHLTAAERHHQVLQTMSEPRYWAIMVWVIVVTFAFCAIRELIHWIAWDRFLEVFFGIHRPADANQEEAA
jgi:hypothetical protein